MKTGWKVTTEDNKTYEIYKSSLTACIKQMVSDGFEEKDIKAAEKISYKN